MTLTAGAVAGLLAVRTPGFNGALYAAAAVGIVLAHAANNLMNDVFDLDVGADSAADYPRALYAPHAILSGMTTRGGLMRMALVVNGLDFGVLVVLTYFRGPLIIAFALAGLFVSAAYAAPPFRLKKRGMGEPSVLIIWGPLMVGGTYFAATGHISWAVLAASLPYGLLATAVLMGKHIDKLPWDRKMGIYSLPVILGEVTARRVTIGLMLAFYVTLGAFVAIRVLPLTALIALVAITRLWPVLGAFRRPRPDKPPEGYPVWPLWYAAAAFVHTRRAGALLVLGLLIADFVPQFAAASVY
jgi:1,4-dihydroxy-2-naphthoate octaprenyltransferase